MIIEADYEGNEDREGKRDGGRRGVREVGYILLDK